MKEIQFIAVMTILAISILNFLKKHQSDTPQEVLDKIQEIKKQAKSIDDLIP